jgi:hypothetical protein
MRKALDVSPSFLAPVLCPCGRHQSPGAHRLSLSDVGHSLSIKRGALMYCLSKAFLLGLISELTYFSQFPGDRQNFHSHNNYRSSMTQLMGCKANR